MARARALAAVVVTVLVAGVASISLSFGVDPGPPAAAAGINRALVIVETGTTTYRKVVAFASDSVTGIQALQLAGAEPIVYSFSGQGGAVCRLFGVGRDAGPGCLGGVDGDNRYWAYFRAPSGTSAFTYSRAGAGSTTVHNGDVEGWKFDTGSPPAWSAVPPEPTTTTTTPLPTTTLPPTTPPPGGIFPSGTGGPAPTPPPGASPEEIAAFWAALTTTTTTPAGEVLVAEVKARVVTRPERGAAGRGVAVGTDIQDGGGNGWVSIIGFGAAVIAIVSTGLYVRRSRRRPIL